MASHNANYKMMILSAGTTYTTNDLGDGLTASTVHEVYCLSAGTINITAAGGGTATFPMTAGQTVHVMVGGCVVSSGIFAGFKAKLNNSSGTQIQWGGNL